MRLDVVAETLEMFAVTPEEHDLLAAARDAHEVHQNVDGPNCEGCGRPWVCPVRTAVEAACLEWLIRRSTAVVRHSAELLAQPRKGIA